MEMGTFLGAFCGPRFRASLAKERSVACSAWGRAEKGRASAASCAVSSRTSPARFVSGLRRTLGLDLRLSISLCLAFVRLAETDNPNSVWIGDVTEQMQPAVQIANCNASRLAPANLGIENSGGKIELRSPLERKSALTNIAFILGGIERDCHSLIVYAIYVLSIRQIQGADGDPLQAIGRLALRPFSSGPSLPSLTKKVGNVSVAHPLAFHVYR